MLLDNRKTQVIEVEVTQEDIDKATALVGLGWRSKTCAVAQALKRQAMDGDWSVAHECATLFYDDGRIAQNYTHDGDELIRAFDAGAPIAGHVRLVAKKN